MNKSDTERITEALVQAKDTILELRYKLDIAIETLEDYEDTALQDAFPWLGEDATKALKKIRGA